MKTFKSGKRVFLRTDEGKRVKNFRIILYYWNDDRINILESKIVDLILGHSSFDTRSEGKR